MNNKLEEFGVGEGFEFTQNSVPFDFTGELLMWMDYLPKGLREIYIYDFATKKKETILSFSNKDGIISHCKLMGTKSSLQLLYVKDTTKIMICDLR